MPMNTSQLEAGVIDILRRMGRDVPSRDTDVFETGILDSIGFVELLASLEQEYGVVFQLDDLEVENFRTVQAISGFIRGSGMVAMPRPAESA